MWGYSLALISIFFFKSNVNWAPKKGNTGDDSDVFLSVYMWPGLSLSNMGHQPTGTVYEVVMCWAPK